MRDVLALFWHVNDLGFWQHILVTSLCLCWEGKNIQLIGSNSPSETLSFMLAHGLFYRSWLCVTSSTCRARLPRVWCLIPIWSSWLNQVLDMLLVISDSFVPSEKWNSIHHGAFSIHFHHLSCVKFIICSHLPRPIHQRGLYYSNSEDINTID